VGFVHPLFLRNATGDLRERREVDKERENTSHGSYSDYVRTLLRVRDAVRWGRGPAFFILDLVEGEEGFTQIPKRPGSSLSTTRFLEAPTTYFEWSFVREGGDYADRVGSLRKVQGGFSCVERLEKREDIARALSQKGVSRVALCGEMGPYGSPPRVGCAGAFAMDLDSQGIEVVGIKDAVFPLKPYEQAFLERMRGEDDITRELKERYPERHAETKAEMRKATELLYDRAVNI